MSAKIIASRRRAFLTHLGNTGNQTLSAERAKVSRSWVQLHRSRDPAFDAACREAIDRARASLAGLETNPPGMKLRYFHGHELVVREACGHRVQIGWARIKQWTRRTEQRFLSALAATCNVTAACAEAGMEKSGAYHHRHRSTGFARAWDQAVEIGYFRIEAALLEHGAHLYSPREVEPDMEMPPMTFDQALHLLNRHRLMVRKAGKPPGRIRKQTATDEEVRVALARALRAFGVRVTKADMQG